MNKAHGLTLALITLSSLAGCSFFNRAGQGPVSGPTILQLAKETPKGACLWVGSELRSTLTPELLSDTVAQLRPNMKELDQGLSELEKETGKSVSELLKIYGAGGFLAIFPKEGSQDLLGGGAEPPVDILIAVAVTDVGAAEALMKPEKLGIVPEEYQGEKLMIAKEKFGYTMHDGYLFLGSSSSILHRCVDIKKKVEDSLSQEAQFKEGLAKVPALSGPGVGTYFNGQPLWNSLEKVGGSYVDKQTTKRLSCLTYAVSVLSTDGKQWSTDAFCKVDSKDADNDFAKALLKAPKLSHQLGSLVPAKWGQAQEVQVFYLFDVLLEVCNLVPQGRMAVPMGLGYLGLGKGSEREKLIREGFTGEFMSSSDLDTLLSSAKSSMGGAREQGQTTACKSNLKNMATAAEMYSTDNAGRYPTTLSQLTPSYLRVMPECMAAGKDSYKFESCTSPDGFTVICQGDHHKMGAGLPAYTSEKGLLLADEAASQPERTKSVRPSTAFLLGVKDKAKVTQLIEPLLSLGTKVNVAGVESVKLELPSNKETYYVAFLDKSNALAVVDSEETLKLLLDAKSVLSSQEDFSRFVASKGSTSASVSYLDLGKLAPLIHDGLAGHSEMAKSVDILEKAFPSLLSPHYSSMSIEADGLRFSGQGSPLFSSGGIAIAGAVLVPNFTRARGQGMTTACKSNEKNIATACEMWSTDNQGRYPKSLNQLTPNYLKTIPTCPAAGADTYSATYKSGANPDSYLFFCSGHHHPQLPADYPKYSSEKGLIER